MLNELQTQSFMRNPAPKLAELRAKAPLVAFKIPILGRVWITTNHAATVQVFKDDKNFTVRKNNGKVVGVSWWMPKLLTKLTSNMLSSDEPEHTRLRSIVDQAFHRRAMLTLEPNINALANKYASALFESGKSADLVSGFSRILPLAVICELLGLPKEDWPKFSKWAEGITTVNGVISFIFAINKLKPLTRYIEERIAYEREHGGQGLIHELVHQDEQLSDDELVAMVFLLLLAGHETTTHLISGGVLALLQNPEQLQMLKEDWSKLDLVVEECLRFVSPVQTGKPRYVREACEVDGVKLAHGDLVMPMILSANYDPEMFENADQFDIMRKPNRHIGFGSGIHFCLGHQLARLEMKAALKALFEQYPDLTLGIAENDIRWNERFGLRSLKSLPVKPTS